MYLQILIDLQMIMQILLNILILQQHTTHRDEIVGADLFTGRIFAVRGRELGPGAHIRPVAQVQPRGARIAAGQPAAGTALVQQGGR